MEVFPGLWFAFVSLVGVLVWGFLIWLAWLLVSSIKGMHTELMRIRQVLGEMSARST